MTRPRLPISRVARPGATISTQDQYSGERSHMRLRSVDWWLLFQDQSITSIARNAWSFLGIFAIRLNIFPSIGWYREDTDERADEYSYRSRPADYKENQL